jgi:hypothetical protein
MSSIVLRGTHLAVLEGAPAALFSAASLRCAQEAFTPPGSLPTRRFDRAALLAIFVGRFATAEAFGVRLLGGFVVRPALHLL